MKKEIYLCFDIGATTTKVAYIEPTNLTIIYRNIFYTKKNNEFFLIEDLIKNLFNEISNCIKTYSILEIGISTSGGVDMATCEVIHCNNTMKDYIGTNWKKLIESHFGFKTIVLNDVKAASLAEFYDRPIKSGVMITLGTGFGVALFVEGKLYAGNRYCAGEVGQMMWPFNHSINVDIACSAVVTTDKIKTIINDQNFKLHEYEKIKDNKKALQIRQEWMQNVAYILQVLNYFYDPELFIIGGGVSKHKDLILEIIKLLPENFKIVEVAKNANDAAFYGLLNAMKQLKGN